MVAEASRVGDDEFALSEIRRLGCAGDDSAANEMARELMRTSSSPRTVATALMLLTGGTVNLGKFDECPALFDEAFTLLAGTGEHGLLGSVHAMAGIVAGRTSTERSLRHLVQSWRELDQADELSEALVEAWNNLAVSFSLIGFHRHAELLAGEGDRVVRGLGLPRGTHARPETTLRLALSLDHRGDTAGCVGTLRDMQRSWADPAEAARMPLLEQMYLCYAMVRLRALGRSDAYGRRLTDFTMAGWECDELRAFGAACQSLVDGHPQEALRQLSQPSVELSALGVGEIHRLRALACEAAGDLRWARHHNRSAALSCSQIQDDLYARMLDVTRVQIDHEQLRQTVDRFEAEALTDPLTGLANRRFFERLVQAESRPCAVGVVDLDSFKAINTVHGHSGGDLVLKRVATILARTLSLGDVVARYGGDEFVVLLPDADLDTAHRTGRRLASSVARDEDWSAIVPGTPVSITSGWAVLEHPSEAARALQDADREMFTGKCRSASQRPTG